MEQERFMNQTKQIAIGCTGIGLLGTTLLYHNMQSIGVVLVTAMAIGYFGWLRKLSLGSIFSWRNLFYVVMMLLLAGSCWYSYDWKVTRYSIVGIVLLAFYVTLRDYYDTKSWSFTKMLKAMLLLIPSSVYNSTLLIKVFSQTRGEKKPNKNLGLYVLGVAMSIPLLAIVIFLLARADRVFEEILDQLNMNLLSKNFFQEGMGRIFWAIVMTFLLYGFVSVMLRKKLPGRQGIVEKAQPIPIMVVITLLTAIYLLFAGIQLVYLFSGNGTLPEGVTYAEYARSGFFELLAVCIFNVVVSFVGKECFQRHWFLDVLLIVMSLCTMVMVASSAMRMLLYIDAYQLTYLRVLVLFALANIALLLAGLIIAIFRPSFSLFTYGVVVLSITYTMFAYSKPDALIASYNIESYLSAPLDKELDLYYLLNSSADAASVIANYQVEIEEYAQGSSMQIEALADYYEEMVALKADQNLFRHNLALQKISW